MTTISVKDAITKWKGHLWIDVRSQNEYSSGHIPGAVNIPILDNHERAIIGTLYKTSERQTAIKRGLDFFGPKMRSIVEQVDTILLDKLYSGDKLLVLYCWRGGMRSNIMAWLLSLYGYEVKLIEGGYKSFRNWCLQMFERDFKYILIGGYTGTGKTKIIHTLSKKFKQPVLDLEGLANHRGSAFGGIGMDTQPTQEMFENKLAIQVWELSWINNYILFEDESQRIGMVSIPQPLWDRMKVGNLIFLKLSFERRLENILVDYGKLDRSLLSSAIIRLQKRLGGMDTKMSLELLVNKDIEGCFRILLKYYDKVYLKSLEKKRGGLKAIDEIDITGNETELLLITEKIKSL
jgi:tRNA 2-selenouridine synthase